MPGGVNSPVRAFNGVGGHPIFFESGAGAYMTDIEGKHYIDYVGSWGPLILGHNHPQVVKAVEEALQQGMTFGASTPREVELAEMVTSLMPSLAMVRMVTSGTEATMTALRLARAYTGRDKILKFAGCYHGHHDALLVEAGSGALTLGHPSSPGVPKAVAEATIVVPFNDLNAVANAFEQHGKDIAAIIVEPIAGNMGCIPPRADFLGGLRHLCDDYGSVLIFDEVMTGFRVALGGAQSIYGVLPDLTTLGKVIGGGLPVGAVGGRSDIMRMLAPEGPVYQAGTLSGNPLAMAAGIATLQLISKPNFYEKLSQMTIALVDGLLECAEAVGISLTANHVGGMFGIFFTENPVFNLDDAKRINHDQFCQFYHGMLQQGIYLAPSPFEAGFVSYAHRHEEITLTLQAAETVFTQVFSEL